jgi:hypothetical protein
LSAFLRTRLARANALGAASLLAVTCHSEPTAVCTVTVLAFTAQPATTPAGSAIAVTVAAQDGSGTTQTCFEDQVTISMGTNPGGATLTGNTTATAVNGVASFTNLVITKSAAGYTLTANGGGKAASSSQFTIAAGPPFVLAFTPQPATTTAGAAISPVVTARPVRQHGDRVYG